MLRTIAGKTQLISRFCASAALKQHVSADNFLKLSTVRQIGTTLLHPSQTETVTSGGQKRRNLDGKVAVLTASTDGIGLAIAKRMCEDGASVMVSSRRQENVDAAVEQLRQQNLKAAGVVCHVSKKEDRQRLVEETVRQFGGIDIFVSNAGLTHYHGPTLQISEDTWDKIFDVNLRSSLLLCQEVVPSMEKRGGGSIVLMGTLVSYFTHATPPEFPIMGAYGVSKCGLIALMKTLTPELAPKNIRINMIAPGAMKTKFTEGFWKDEQNSKIILKMIPLNRFGTAEECAGMTSFLASDDASYITGESIVIGGGIPSRL